MKSRVAFVASLLVSLSCLSACTPRASKLTAPLMIKGAFNIPESILYDADADVYLVSNINGNFFGLDGKGFISRVKPDGTIEAIKWIDGEKDGVTLGAPKGMAVVGDTLYVADVTVVRKFDRKTGAPKGDIAVPGAAFLNDLTTASDGTLYVSDTGLKEENGDLAPSGTDAIYTIDAEDQVKALIKGPELGQPNGLLAVEGGVMVINWAKGEMFTVKADGTKIDFAKLSKTQLDGVVQDAKGNYLVSSWEGKCIFSVSSDGKTETCAFEKVDAPADLGFDTKRGRLLTPLFNEKQLRVDQVD